MSLIFSVILGLVLTILGAVVPWLFSFVPQDLRSQVAADVLFALLIFFVAGVKLWYRDVPHHDSESYRQEEQTWATMSILDQFRNKRD